MARTKTPARAASASAADRARKLPASPAVSNTDIARRAYDLYLSRGREDGHDIEDWLQAERELRPLTAATA